MEAGYLAVFVDKTSWPDGPWKEEVDRLEWVDESTGFYCIIQRNPDMGMLCGYVGVPSTHPLHGVHYSEYGQEQGKGKVSEVAPENMVDVHGGITYSGERLGDDEWRLKDDLWYFGFDCGHCSDLMPGRPTFAVELWSEFEKILDSRRGVYRDINYVKEQCTHLAQQLKDLKSCTCGETHED